MKRDARPGSLAQGTRSLKADVDVTIRALHTLEEFEGCVREQRATWGEDYRDVVPAAILQVARKVGGVVAGAFVDDALIGFVFGLTGLRHGRLVHWSHMLAVHPELRDHGIGRRLKEFQREQVLALGVEIMNWTFDPLVARNAHLNLNRLGVQVEEYVPDMYGDTGSQLHRFGTDRFIVSWRLTDSGLRPESPSVGLASLPLVELGAAPTAARVRIEMPHDVEAMFVAAPDEAVRWRERTRAAFQSCVSRGYRVEGFHREPGTDRCFYVMASDAAGEVVP
jgi:chorismate synthase